MGILRTDAVVQRKVDQQLSIGNVGISRIKGFLDDNINFTTARIKIDPSIIDRSDRSYTAT